MTGIIVQPGKKLAPNPTTIYDQTRNCRTSI